MPILCASGSVSIDWVDLTPKFGRLGMQVFPRQFVGMHAIRYSVRGEAVGESLPKLAVGLSETEQVPFYDE